MTAPTTAATGGAPDQSRTYGEQFHSVYDRLVPGGDAAERTVDLLLSLTDVRHPVVVELGVGSGRIALPLARRGARVTGVDSSPHLLAVARAAAAREGLDIRLVEADIRSWVPDEAADLVVCVCATLAQLLTVDEQRRAMAVAAASARPGGIVVVETHSPDRVRLLHSGARTVELELPLDGVPGQVLATSTLHGGTQPADGAGLDGGAGLAGGDGLWRLDHRWRDDGGMRSATEYARLVEPAQLAELAAAVGLRTLHTYADWAASPAHRLSPTYICVLEAPESPPATAPAATPQLPADPRRTVHSGESI